MKLYKSKRAEERILVSYDQLLHQWGVDYEERNIQTRYGDTHIITCGESDKPALLLFHGVGDDSALMWVYNAKALSRHFRIFAVDTIGGPGKSRPNLNYGKGFDSVIWIDEVLDRLGLGEVRMAGVSQGAYIALNYTAARPNRVKKTICLAASVPVAGVNYMWTMLKIFLPEALFPTNRNTERLIRKLTGTNSDVFLKNEVIMEHYQSLLKGFNNMAMSYHKIIPLNDDQIDSLRDKVLYLVGEDDPFAIRGGKKVLISKGMRVRFLENVGHGINHEISDEINKIVVETLSD